MANPTPSTSSAPNLNADKTFSREAELSMLSSAIEITAIGKQVGTIELVKAAFSAVSIVLTKIKDTMNNQDDFIDVGVYCAQICSAIDRGTHGKTEEDLSPSFVEAIKELTRTVNDIRATADKNLSRTVFSRALFSDRDKEKIAGWQQDLSRLLQIFNTELNVTTTTTVQSIDGKLDALTQDIKDIKEGRIAAGSELSGERPPPPPSVFFGREQLVGEVLNHVQERKHVALIGAGGIGKTSIAKAVLNDSSAQKHFTAGQFFLKCDDFVLSLDRFLGRVAEVVGAKISQSSPLPSLRSFFLSRTQALLLVLDNAETILESPIKADVSDAIDEISSCSMVTLLITTRTTILPNNSRWIRKQVTPLDVDSARAAFFYVHTDEEPSSVIDAVLIEVDCHPLSINILASAAAQDSLSIDELKQRWDVEKAHLLDPGSGFGKQQSLAASIRLSLNSPMMQNDFEGALQVLQLVAFLPQGVETTTLQQLVPTVGNASRIADTLGRLSLTYRHGKFITMLAPIRLYILDMHPPGPLLLGITTFYCGKLDEYGSGDPGDEKLAHGSWICSHDDNIERLIVHQLSTAPDESTIAACSSFLYCILMHKPRKTILGAVVEALDDAVSMYWKAISLRILGLIATHTGNLRETREPYNLARNTFLAGGYKDMATMCLIELADVSFCETDYAEAHRQCTQALAECHESQEPQDLLGEYPKAKCQQILGQIALDLGRHSEASEFLTKALEFLERQNVMVEVARVKVELGRLEFERENFEEGRSHFDAAAVILSDSGNNLYIGMCSYEFARQETRVGNFSKALDLLHNAEKFLLMANSILNVTICVQDIGFIHYCQKEYSAAKAHLTKAKEKFDALGSVERLMQNAYYLACVEFREENSQEARQILKEAKQWFSAENKYWQAIHTRGLGEFAFHEGDEEGAAVLFAQAQEEFEAIGFTSQKVDKVISEMDSEGWRWFRGGRHTDEADLVEGGGT